MKNAEVTVGMQCVTRVSGQRVWVEVVRERSVWTHRRPARVRRFIVKRLDTGSILPKPRAASALHVDDQPFPES